MSKKEFPSDAADRFQLRMPEGLRERIKQAAAESNRSMNAEIIATLEEAYPADPPLDEVLDAIEVALNVLKRQPDSIIGRVSLLHDLKDVAEKLSSTSTKT